MVECTCRKIYETSNKVGVHCVHPDRCIDDGQPKRITCGLVCQACTLDKLADPYDYEPAVRPDPDADPDD